MGQPHAASHVPQPCPMQIQREQQQRKLQLDNAQFIQWLLLLLLLRLVLVVVPVVLLLIVVVVVVVVVLRRRRLVHTLQFCYIFFCSSFFYLKPLLFLPRSFFSAQVCVTIFHAHGHWRHHHHHHHY